MKRAVVLLLVALVLVSTACLVGCGEDKAIIKRTDGEVDTGENGVSTTEVSEGDLGVPIYPGAEMIEGDEEEIAAKLVAIFKKAGAL